MKTQHPLQRLSVLCCCLLLLAGCGARLPTGQWQGNTEARHSFEAGTLFPDHTYYYLGSIAGPESVIAIDNRYTLRSKVWAQVDMTQERMNSWLQWYKTDNSRVCDFFGGVILTPDGRRAGMWYSVNLLNTVEMPEPGVLVIYQPTSFSGSKCGMSDGSWFFER